MARVTRSGSARPQGGGWELAIWYGMRLTGLGLFVLALAHYLITHFLSDPASQNAQWIGIRWDNIAWRTIDWLMLAFVIFHGFMGLRTVVGDYTQRRRPDRDHDGPLPRRDRPVRAGHDRAGHAAAEGARAVTGR